MLSEEMVLTEDEMAEIVGAHGAWRRKNIEKITNACLPDYSYNFDIAEVSNKSD